MKIKNKICGDRSGVSTLLIAIIIIIIVVIVAVAAYVLLVGNDNNNNNQELAPGTTLTYDFTDSSGATVTMEKEIIGQNATQYFEKITAGDSPATYNLSPKLSSNDAELTGTADLDTIDGQKTLNIWEYTIIDPVNGSENITSYADQGNGLFYKIVATYADPDSTTGGQLTDTMILTDKNLVWQSSYKESSSIGKTYEYSYTVVGTVTFPASIICVADCLNGQFGIEFDFSAIDESAVIYFLSDNIQGLPTDAVNSGTTTDLTNTIDGDLTAEIWTVAQEGGTFAFCYEPNSHIIYVIALITGGVELDFNLVSKA